ncbi:MAG: hypothetical protein WAL98_15145 [Desulfatiglandaceae bacterium]|jgi:uncharacterized protein
MKTEKAIHVLDGGRILAEYGPMRLVISAWIGRLPQRDMCSRAAEEAFLYLERVASLRDQLSRPVLPGSVRVEDPLAENMIESVRKVGDDDLTPMAAVAGTIADAVADFLFNRGMNRVIVNNGGDIAVRLRGKETITVGIGSGIPVEKGIQAITLDSSISSWGVATSGLGGRSFTRGVASAVTILAENASLADAAATAVGNACFVEDAGVIQRPAGEIDPSTDIGGLLVTVKAGPLSREKKRAALSRAMKRAKSLSEEKIILGAYADLQGKEAMDVFFRQRLMAL